MGKKWLLTIGVDKGEHVKVVFVQESLSPDLYPSMSCFARYSMT